MALNSLTTKAVSERNLRFDSSVSTMKSRASSSNFSRSKPSASRMLWLYASAPSRKPWSPPWLS